MSTSDSRRRALIRSIEHEVAQDSAIPCLTIQGNPNTGAFRKTAYAFPMRTGTAANLGQVSDALLIEINSFANPEPSSEMPIVDAHWRLLDRRRSARPRAAPRARSPSAFTYCAWSVRYARRSWVSCAPATKRIPLEEFRRRIRHFYDVAMIMRVDSYRHFVASDAFVDLMVAGKGVRPRVHAGCPRVAVTLRSAKPPSLPTLRAPLAPSAVGVPGQLQGHGVRRLHSGRRRGAGLPCFDWHFDGQNLRTPVPANHVGRHVGSPSSQHTKDTEYHRVT